MRLSVVTRPRPDARGTLPIYLRIEHGGTTRYVSLSLRIPAKDWNPRKQQVRATNVQAPRWNQLLADRLSVAQDAALSVQASGRHFTADRIRDTALQALHPVAVEAVESPGFVSYARSALVAYEARGAVATALAYRSGVERFATYVKGDVGLSDVSPSVVRGWHAALVREGLKPNTVHKYVSALRTIARQAESEGLEGAAGAVQAFASVKLRKERAHKDRLTLAQVSGIAALDLAGRAADVRDWYVFAFYVGGMRFSDVALLRWSDVDTGSEPWRVRWRQKKTAERHTLPALGPARNVLERWQARRDGPFVFGLLTEAEARSPKALRGAVGRWNALANKRLYTLQAQVGAPRTGFHSARNSIADHLRLRGVSIYDISKILGHANIRITEVYLRGFDSETTDDALSGALGLGAP